MRLSVVSLVCFAVLCCIVANISETREEIASKSFLALYFPQFHPVAENRAIINGTGFLFNEWDNFNEAKLVNVNKYGHKVLKPAMKYDLRKYSVRKFHATEAKRIGVDAFIYYHYWLENHAVMDAALKMMLLDGEPSLPFAFCFANEGWSGSYSGILRSPFEQLYDIPQNHAVWFAPFFKHKNYLHHNGHPVLYVYLMNALPQQYVVDINTQLALMGIPSMHIIGFVMSYHSNFNKLYQQDTAEFPPHIPGSRVYNEELDWADASGKHLGKGFPLARGLLTSWDNTARSGNV